MPGTAVASHSLFEPLHCRALCKPVRFEDSLYCSNIFLVDVLVTVGDMVHPLFNFRSSLTDRKRELVPELYSKPSRTIVPASPSALTEWSTGLENWIVGR